MSLLPELFAKAVNTDTMHADILLPVRPTDRTKFAKSFEEGKPSRDVQVIMESLRHESDGHA